MTALDLLAPAKINLTLGVTGKLPSGYHALDSIVAFADIGDRIRIAPSAAFSFSIHGPFADSFTAAERDSSARSPNMAVRAARLLAAETERPMNFALGLDKHLPLASGVGGGSADAAAVLWGLAEWWNTPKDGLYRIAAMLGSDVAACLDSRPVRMRGAGEVLDPLPGLPETPVVLANPCLPCATAEVYRRFDGTFTAEAPPPAFDDPDGLLDFLAMHGNALTSAAVSVVPEIAFVLDALKAQPGCRLARMSGSGATCFALFGDTPAAAAAARTLASRHPGWWVRDGLLNSPARY